MRATVWSAIALATVLFWATVIKVILVIGERSLA